MLLVVVQSRWFLTQESPRRGVEHTGLYSPSPSHPPLLSPLFVLFQDLLVTKGVYRLCFLVRFFSILLQKSSQFDALLALLSDG